MMIAKKYFLKSAGMFAVCFVVLVVASFSARAQEYDEFSFDYGMEDVSAPAYDAVPAYDSMPAYNPTHGFDQDFGIADASTPDLVQPMPLTLNENTSFVAVSELDIAGVFLGMTFEDAHTLFFRSNSLYAPRRKNAIVYSIPKDWRYSLDYECRQQKIIIPAELEKCINSLAKSRGLLYASEMHLARESTGETIEVNFTSNASGNKVWRVVYNNDADVVEGGAAKFQDQREKKLLSFWQGVLDKYGAPNSGPDKWISSDNSFDPMMVAYYGRLELTDHGMSAMDVAENASRSREHFRAKPYAF